MAKFTSPLGIEFGSARLARAILHVLTLLAALGLTAGLWLGAAQASRSHSPLGFGLAQEAVPHIELPRVVIVAHREPPAETAVAALAASYCANGASARPAGANPIRVTLQ